MNLNQIGKTLKQDQTLLANWFINNSRELPWRLSKDPYRIWISEVMLQQTTVAAVIPFYQRFLEAFPKVSDLAQASIEDVYAHWSGLGYYSRARNLHKAAQEFSKKGFPKTAQELINFPGIGPYTARAVASLAFGEKVGVVDGNVIRVLSRKYGIDVDWWKNENRHLYQSLADQLADHDDSSIINQGLMELGATVCTPKKTTCIICPWMKSCSAIQTKKVEFLPRQKPRKTMETWIFEPQLLTRKRADELEIGLTSEHGLPVLKNALFLPGLARKVLKKPKNFKVKHTITHHQIFISEIKTLSSQPHKIEWITQKDLTKKSPSILLQKILQASEIDLNL